MTALAFFPSRPDDGFRAGHWPARLGKGWAGVPVDQQTLSPPTGGDPWSDDMRAIAQGSDRDAFARLFRHFAPRIKTYLVRQGAEAAVADDLAQEAMLSVWRKSATFDPARAGVATWIYTIARNLRIDQLRRERRPSIEMDDPNLVADPAPPADEVVDASRRERLVRDALGALPAEQAQVIGLSFFEDAPHAEIAQRLKIPLGTVKSRLRLAMKRIRAQLGEEP